MGLDCYKRMSQKDEPMIRDGGRQMHALGNQEFQSEMQQKQVE